MPQKTPPIANATTLEELNLFQAQLKNAPADIELITKELQALLKQKPAYQDLGKIFTDILQLISSISNEINSLLTAEKIQTLLKEIKSPPFPDEHFAPLMMLKTHIKNLTFLR